MESDALLPSAKCSLRCFTAAAVMTTLALLLWDQVTPVQTAINLDQAVGTVGRLRHIPTLHNGQSHIFIKAHQPVQKQAHFSDAVTMQQRTPVPTVDGGSAVTISFALMAFAGTLLVWWQHRGQTPKPLAMAATSGDKVPIVSQEESSAAVPQDLKWSWQQTMLRVKDPTKSLAFYQDLLGFTLLDRLDFPDMKFSLYFLTTLPDGETYPHTPGTAEAHQYLWTYKGVTLELTHNWGTESQPDFKYHPGNMPGDGFGHVAVACDDVEARCEELEAAGVTFKKKPNEGRMKGLAFAYDPDGYWVEIVRRGNGVCNAGKYNFAQTMLRVRDPAKSIPFYEGLGMTLVCARHFSDFSLYFMANLPKGSPPPPSPESPEAMAYCGTLYNPVLELTHNHGTEKQEGFVHDNGNVEGRRGFGHIGFLVEDVDHACAQLEPLGYGFVKKPSDGKMKGLAFAKDPDGYWVEIIKRGGYDAAATPYWLEPPAP